MRQLSKTEYVRSFHLWRSSDDSLLFELSIIDLLCNRLSSESVNFIRPIFHLAFLYLLVDFLLGFLHYHIFKELFIIVVIHELIHFVVSWSGYRSFSKSEFLVFLNPVRDEADVGNDCICEFWLLMKSMGFLPLAHHLQFSNVCIFKVLLKAVTWIRISNMGSLNVYDSPSTLLC